MIINRKSQLGTITITVPVFFILVLIIAFYLLAAAGISIFNFLGKPTSQEGAFTLPAGENLLLQTVKLKVNNIEREFLVYDSIHLLLEENDIGQREIHKALDELDVRTGNCYFLEVPIDPVSSYAFSSNKELTISDEDYFGEENLTVSYLEFLDKEIKIISYFGKCPGS